MGTPSMGDITKGNSAREECYARIRKVMKRGLEGYYRKHPDRVNDARAADALESSLRGLEQIFLVLDGFEIRYRKDTR